MVRDEHLGSVVNFNRKQKIWVLVKTDLMKRFLHVPTMYMEFLCKRLSADRYAELSSSYFIK